MNKVFILLQQNWFSKISFFFTLLFPLTLSAHPHAWVDTNTYIESDDTHITALHMTWTFDAENIHLHATRRRCEP